MKKTFLTKKQIAVIVKNYGGYRKYKVNESVTREYGSLYLCQKSNQHLWMVISGTRTEVEVRFTDETGLIVKRDYWEMIIEVPVIKEVS